MVLGFRARVNHSLRALRCAQPEYHKVVGAARLRLSAHDIGTDDTLIPYP